MVTCLSQTELEQNQVGPALYSRRIQQADSTTDMSENENTQSGCGTSTISSEYNQRDIFLSSNMVSHNSNYNHNSEASSIMSEESLISQQGLQVRKLASKVRYFGSDFINEFTKTECLTADFNEQPDWLKDNKYLRCGHRRPTYSFITCTRSIFQLHNETVNIWTHLLGGFYFAHLCLQLFTSTILSPLDKWVIGLFLASATTCHVLSTIYHIFNCHSEHVSKVCSRMDYCGIIALITFSFVPWIHYGFYLYPMLKLTYLIAVVTLGLTAVNLLMQDRYSEKRHRWLRVSVFILFGISGIIPGLHWLNLNHDVVFVEMALKQSFYRLVTMGALYLIGTMLYAFRIPERYFPGKCDIWWHSHQLFHVFVSAATLVHFYGITELANHVKRQIDYGTV